MARAFHPLTARRITTIPDAGRHADGGGLDLRVTPPDARSCARFRGAPAGRPTLVARGLDFVILTAAQRRGIGRKPGHGRLSLSS